MKITLRIRDEKFIFKSVKPASSLIKKVYMLILKERMELDLEARLMGETLVLNRSLDLLYRDYIEINDLNVPLELRRDQVDDLMPTIEEVLEDMDAYHDEGMGDIIFGEPFLSEVRINARWFGGMITIYNGNEEVTYQMVRSYPRFKRHTNKKCNKIPPLVKVIIMEYLVKISKKARILELKRRYFEDYYSDNQYAVSIKENTTNLCVHFKEDHEGNKINTPYPGKTNAPYSSYGNKIFWKISNVFPTLRNPQYVRRRRAEEVLQGLRKKYRLNLKNDMPPRDK
nr:hypothetical protein [Tanacetum cinerariifolium]